MHIYIYTHTYARISKCYIYIYCYNRYFGTQQKFLSQSLSSHIWWSDRTRSVMLNYLAQYRKDAFRHLI